MNSYINQKQYYYYTYCSERIIEVKLNIGRGKLLYIGLCAPEEGGVEGNVKFITNYRKYYTKLTKMITSYSREACALEYEKLKSIIL